MIIEKVTDGINGAAVTSPVGTFGGQILFDWCRDGCVKSFVGGAVTAEDFMKKILHSGVIDRILQQYASGVGASQKTGKTGGVFRSEEHTSELQSLMRISYAVFCLKKKKK